MADVRVGSGEDCGGEEGGVFGAVTSDTEGCNGDPGGHLDGGEECIHSFERSTFHGYAEHGEGGVRGENAGKVCGESGPGDDDAQASLFCGARVFTGVIGCAVGGEHPAFVGDVEIVEDFGGFFHRRPVRGASHEDADERIIDS